MECQQAKLVFAEPAEPDTLGRSTASVSTGSPSSRGEGVPSTGPPFCAFVGQTRRPLQPSPAPTQSAGEKAWLLCRRKVQEVSCLENPDALEDLSGAGESALRGPAEQAREARGRDGRTPCPALVALRLPPGSRTHACSRSSFGLAGGDRAGGGWAAEVRGEEPEEPELPPPQPLPQPPPPPPEKSMSATRAKKVKMATKSCPECDQQVPVACKSCPCGCIFINRKLLKVKHSEKSSPFTGFLAILYENKDLLFHFCQKRCWIFEVNNTISLKDLRILFLYEFKLGHSAATASRNINSVFGKGSVSERTTRWWFEKFRSGDLSLKNEPRGRPKSVLNEDQLRAMVEANPKTAIRGLAADLGVSATTISRHLAAIGKVKKLDKWTLEEHED
ncbi:UPF0547 protein C16orf87 homolog [Meles meles]|uniref:UPF0547 protein C16orf87 homolog n=1 Tax=Meles meles TaxID=9662 RepID=UPI001E69A352|nr:UPF0547 protein C16orf87 homolog [Meles meles]